MKALSSHKKGSFREYLIIAAAAAVFTVLLLGHALTVVAGEKTVQKAPEAFYTSIKISQQDTWEKIADRYNNSDLENRDDYISEIREINGIEGTRLHPGCYLTVKYYKE